MHGIIHVQLQRFVETQHGAAAWRELTKRAGLEDEIFTALRSYPDEQVDDLVNQAVKMTGTPRDELLEAFGKFLVPTYLSVYGSLLKRDWNTIDVVEHTEETIHRVVRARQPGAHPPKLRTERVSETEVRITYTSSRKLCAVARGIVRGIARHFQENVQVSDLSCMLRGDPACLIAVRLRS